MSTKGFPSTDIYPYSDLTGSTENPTPPAGSKVKAAVPPPKDEPTGKAEFQSGHMVVEPVCAYPATPDCNMLNDKYRGEGGRVVNNMWPMQIKWPDSE